MKAFFERKQENKVFARMLNEMDFPLHLHPQMELLFVFSGEVMTTVRDRTQVLKDGMVAVIFPNEIHSYTSMAADISIALVHWDLSYTGGYMDTLLMNHPMNPFLKIEMLHPNILYVLQELIEEYKVNEQGSVYAPLIQLLLARLIPILELERNKIGDYPELTYQIAHYMSEHFQESLTIGRVAQGLGISKYHLSHLFSEKMGQNFPSYLSSIRLSYACKLLAETDMPMIEIAGEAGFESQSTFFRVFRRHLGTTPYKYRKKVLYNSNKKIYDDIYII